MPARPLLEDHSSSPAPAIAITIPLRLVGLILLGFVAVVMVSLASWNVDDPSFSYATSTPARNWLGFPGAVIADISFQVLGLGIIALLVPLAMWGWSFVRRRLPSRMGLRLIAWIAATALTTGVLSFLPAPESWPLPTGLGGLIGSGFTNLAALVTGDNPQPVTAWLFAIILLAPTLALFWMALGLGAIALPKMPAAAPAQGKKGKAAPAADEPEKNGVLDVVIGAAVHLGFSASTALRRAIVKARENAAARREAEAQPWRDGAVEPAMAGGAPRVLPEGRQEPQLHVERRIFAPQQPEAAAYEDDYADEEIDEIAPVAPARPPRVTAPPRRPAPGARAAREAQPSLLEESDGFELPALGLLAEAKHRGLMEEHRPERLEAMARRLEGVLEDFGVKGDIINVRPGPVVTLYELEPAPGIKSSRVISLADDIARSMSAISARVAVVPGRNAIGIELPNEQRETVYLREMLASQDFEKMKGKLPICLGKTIGGEPIIADLARMPHLLIAGTTGSGKSVGINTFILSLLYQMTPEQCRLIMIDPKMLELSIYDGIPHLLTPVVTDPQKAVVALKWAVREMEDRYRKMSKIGVRNIDGFNQRVSEAAKEGRTGTLCFVTVEHAVEADGARLIDERQDIVYRGLDVLGGSGKAPPAAAQGQHQRPMRAEPPLLFRYSALTFNGHRIHYDRRYVTEVEGYPGLVVHGPMQAAMLCDYATELRGMPPTRFEFRGMSPLFDDDDFVLHASVAGETLELWTAKANGTLCMTATAYWS